jgi:hypothetical protein
MRAYLGKDFEAHRKGSDVNVIWDAAQLQNGHTLFLGRPGAGKTHQLRRFLTALMERNNAARIHIFDVHDDIELDGASEVYFSEITPYGLNPLKVASDPHFGGVNKCINSFIRTVSAVSGTLGPRQQALLRVLLHDVYRARGFDPEDPDTWVVDEGEAHLVSDGSDGRLYLNVPFAEKDDAKALGAIWERNIRVGSRAGLWWVPVDQYTGGITRWLPMTVGRMHPTLADVIMHAKRQLMISFLGSDQAAVTALEAFLKASAAHSRRELEMLKSGGVNRPDGGDDSGSPKERAAAKAMDAFANYLAKTRTGDELEDLIKYDKVDNLKSIIDRLETLKAAGIFKSEAPPFDERAALWRYRISPLTQTEKRLFVLFRLQELFYAAISRGQQKQILDVIVLDEAHLYADESGDDILSTLAREARKFGVAIIAVNQTPELPKTFMASLATKIILGIDESFWTQATSKMGIPAQLLSWVKPRACMAVQMHDSSELSGKWRGVMLRMPAQAQGAQRQAAAAQG